MATQKVVSQSLGEIRTHPADFGPDLPDGVTVSSATAVHTPPSGTAVTPTVAAASPLVNITLGPLTVTGVHKCLVTATLSDGEKSEILLIIPVKW